MPGIELSRFAASSARACSARSSFKASIRTSSDRHSARMSPMSVWMRFERSEGRAARNGSISRSRTLAPLPEGMPTLERDRPELVHKRLARRHQTRAGSIQGLQVEPVLALQLDEAQGRPRRASAIPAASLSSIFCART